MGNSMKNFIGNLKKLKPSNINGDIPRIILKMYEIEEKKLDEESSAFIIDGNTIFHKLFLEHTMDRIRFADFRLNFQLENISEDIIGFAESSHSILGFHKDENYEEVYEYDKESLNPLEPVAQNQESFLNAILLLMELYARKYEEPSIEKKKELELQFYTPIIQRAGGETYSRFFKNIIF
jgi:hypothetical protein